MSIKTFSILLLAICFSKLSTVYCVRGFGGGEQEWGYVTVRPGAHTFWWLYYTTNEEVSSFYEKPLIVWLQGGPGVSGTGYGNFGEIGPLNSKLEPRNHTWVKNFNVLFIDNPVGTGFSYVDNEEAYATTSSQIGKDLLEMMRAFYEKLPKFRQVPVFIFSESYGGKYAVELAHVWHEAQKSRSIKSNLKGVALGDAWISPIDGTLSYGPFLLQMGFVDTDGYERIQAAALKTKKAVDAGLWDKAMELEGRTEDILLDVTDKVDFYNVLTKIQLSKLKARSDGSRPLTEKRPKRSLDDDVSELENLMLIQVTKFLNLNSTKIWEDSSDEVFIQLNNDFMRPVVHTVERLLNETDLKVVVYNGQLDLAVPTSGQVQWTENMKWRFSEKWRASPRTALVANGIIEGYRKAYKNFVFYWVNRAGHMVPDDNPPAMAKILEEMTGH